MAVCAKRRAESEAGKKFCPECGTRLALSCPACGAAIARTAWVGRDRELRQIKELFHASAEERKAHLISITGIAGIGKSRLAWSSTRTSTGCPS